MDGPVVSVLLPVRDAQATVGRAVDSMLGQSLRALEVVIVDDGSRDGTREVLADLARKDARVRTVFAARQGLVPALTRGLALCRGEFVARMDADDESLPERLERSVDALERDPRLAAVGTGVEVVREDRPVSPNMHAYARWLSSLVTPEALHADRFVESPLCHPATTLRRGALEDVGAWKDNGFAEDYQLWLDLLARGFRLVNLPQVLFRWTDSEGRLTRVDRRYSLERLTALKAHFLARHVLPARRCWVWGAGPTGLQLTRALNREGVTVSRFFDVDPRKIGTRIDGVGVSSHVDLPPPGEHLLAAVGAKGARAEIRAHLSARGWREGEHFTCTA
jgi:glycosyltransferase involved in cell wall biosynthesis